MEKITSVHRRLHQYREYFPTAEEMIAILGLDDREFTVYWESYERTQLSMFEAYFRSPKDLEYVLYEKGWGL